MDSGNPKFQDGEFVKIDFFDKQNIEDVPPISQRRDFFEIIFFKNIAGLDHYVDFSPNTAQNGDIFVVQPGQVHYFKSMVGEQYEMVILSFSKSFKRELCLDESITNFFDQLEFQSIIFNFDDCRSKDLDYCLWQLEYEIVVKAQFWDRMILHYIRMLITLLNRDGIENGRMPQMNQFMRANHQFKKMVEANFVHHLDVSDYAKLLKISIKDLRLTTQEAMRILPGEYINWRLNLEAKRLLFFKQLEIGQIAERLGFKKTAHFVQFFLEKNNTSPKHFQETLEHA